MICLVVSQSCEQRRRVWNHWWENLCLGAAGFQPLGPLRCHGRISSVQLAVTLVSDFHCCAERKPHTASLVLHHGELAEFDVIFKPNLAQRAEGKIHLSVVDNPFEETSIQLVGEGYEDDFTLDDIHGLVADGKEENTEGDLEEDIIEGKRGEAAKMEQGSGKYAFLRTPCQRRCGPDSADGSRCLL